MSERTLIVYGGGEQVVLRGDQVDTFFEIGREQEDPDALKAAKAVKRRDNAS